ncbi:hypothetical protein SPB21_35375 [Leptothoe sp. ISB3NOV94-8A]
MGPLSKYWEILRIDPGDEGLGYKKQFLPLASEFFYAEFSELIDLPKQPQLSFQKHRDVQTTLHLKFLNGDVGTSIRAGLCLRSYITYNILRACKILASKFSFSGQFTYRDLLPYVLNDDGELQIVLDADRKKQLIVNHNGELEPSTYKLFTVEVLRKFNPQGKRVSSLDNWVHLLVRQNPDLQDFLVKQGYYKLSDWALLNRAGSSQLENLAPRERDLMRAFHAVYRRDRRQQQQTHLRSSPAPSIAQLQEMQQYLQGMGINVDLPEQLNTELKRLAQVLRQYAIWRNSGMPQAESLTDQNSGIQREFSDPNSINALEKIEQQELVEFFEQQLVECLDWGIERAIHDRVLKMQGGKYAEFASKIPSILKMVYHDDLPQRQIASDLGITQARLSRITRLNILVKEVRAQSIQRFLDVLLSRLHGQNLTELSSDSEYLSNLFRSVEAFVDARLFESAFSELKTARSAPMKSIYSQRLRHYLQQHSDSRTSGGI